MGGEGQEHDCALGSNLNQSRTAAVDPKHAFKIDPMNARKGRKAAVGATGKMRHKRTFTANEVVRAK